VLKKPAQALVAVFSGSTGGPVWFLKLCFRHPTTGNGGFAVRHSGTAKDTIRTATALPCVDARQRTHGSVISGNGFVAVRRARNRRQSLCRGMKSLPCALGSLPCCRALPCVQFIAVRADAAVRPFHCCAHKRCRVSRPLSCYFLCRGQWHCRAHFIAVGCGVARCCMPSWKTARQSPRQTHPAGCAMHR
jgi:hypothetical protein